MRLLILVFCGILLGMSIYGWLRQKPSSEIYYPLDYPPTAGATEVWNWGEATGDYTSEIQGDLYVAGSGGTPGHLYGQTGPTGSNMSAVYWRNDGSFNSHHTSPGTTSGQSNGPVNANMKPGTSSFKFYFLMRSTGATTAYIFFDYDQQQDAATFLPGMQFFVSTAGLFAPCSLIVTIRSDTSATAEFHAKTGGTTLFVDSKWHLVEMVFDVTQATPRFYIDSNPLTVLNTFGGPALNTLGAINPTDGIRFGMKEFNETTTGRADLQMAAAAYSKDLTYTWR